MYFDNLIMESILMHILYMSALVIDKKNKGVDCPYILETIYGQRQFLFLLIIIIETNILLLIILLSIITLSSVKLKGTMTY